MTRDIEACLYTAIFTIIIGIPMEGSVVYAKWKDRGAKDKYRLDFFTITKQGLLINRQEVCDLIHVWLIIAN